MARSEDEVYEVVDLTEYARRHQWWSRVFGSNSGPIAEKYSSCAGYLFQRVGKIAATAVGGGFLLLQIANHTGYVQINWKKVEKDVTKPRSTSKNGRTSSATDFIKRNIVLSSGFVGGFFLGIAPKISPPPSPSLLYCEITTQATLTFIYFTSL
uniref:FUN14 domain containing 1 n=1 Tax=Neogobius melanostomus TaxID=47308 RepID=A0A8C6UTZ3_9GOBI